jgi:hypothetical protein
MPSIRVIISACWITLREIQVLVSLSRNRLIRTERYAGLPEHIRPLVPDVLRALAARCCSYEMIRPIIHAVIEKEIQKSPTKLKCCEASHTRRLLRILNI